MPTEFKFTITEEQIERAIVQAIGERYVDDDGDEIESVDINAIVERKLNEKVDKAIGKVVPEVIRELIGTRVLQHLEEGFPQYSVWGKRESTITLADLVRAEINRKDVNGRHQYDLAEFIRREAKKHIDVEVGKLVKAAADQVGAMFTEAAAEGLASLMKRALGVKV